MRSCASNDIRFLTTFDILSLIPCCASSLVFLPAVIKAMLLVLGIDYRLHGVIFCQDKAFLSLETTQQHLACNSQKRIFIDVTLVFSSDSLCVSVYHRMFSVICSAISYQSNQLFSSKLWSSTSMVQDMCIMGVCLRPCLITFMKLLRLKCHT